MKKGLINTLYRKQERAGCGTFGEVWLATRLADEKQVAIKRLRDTAEQNGDLEVHMLKRLHGCTHVVALLEVVDERYIVMECMQHDLCGLLKRKDIAGRWSRSQVKGYAQQLMTGIAYCHARGIMHRDIKPENLLLGQDNVLKLADFGLATYIRPDTEHTNPVATRWYRPLEILYGARLYGPEVDIWSAGCVLGELFQRSPLLPGESDSDQPYCIYALCGTPLENGWPEAAELPLWQHYAPAKPVVRNLQQSLVVENKLVERRKFFSEVAVELLDAMLHLVPSKRPTAAQVLEHAYFGNTRDGVDVQEARDMLAWNEASHFGGGNVAKRKK